MDVAVEKQPTYPEGQYAKLEMMGHRTLWGRISEVTVFGAAMLKIEPIVGGQIVGEVLTGAASIYCLTKCSAEAAFRNAPSDTRYDSTLRLLAPPTPFNPEIELAPEDDDGAVGEDHEDEYNSEHPDHPDYQADDDVDVDATPEAAPRPACAPALPSERLLHDPSTDV